MTNPTKNKANIFFRNLEIRQSSKGDNIIKWVKAFGILGLISAIFILLRIAYPTITGEPESGIVMGIMITITISFVFMGWLIDHKIKKMTMAKQKDWQITTILGIIFPIIFYLIEGGLKLLGTQFFTAIEELVWGGFGLVIIIFAYFDVRALDKKLRQEHKSERTKPIIGDIHQQGEKLS